LGIQPALLNRLTAHPVELLEAMMDADDVAEDEADEERKYQREVLMASLITSWRAFAPEDCDAEEDPAETDEFAEYGDTVSHLSTTHYDGRHTPVGLGLSLSRNVSGAALADMGASFGQAQKEQQHVPSHHQSHKHLDAR